MKKAIVFGIGGVGLALAILGSGYRATSTCVLGVRGTRATVTIQAAAATFRCKAFAQSNGDYYVRTEPVTEPVLCEGEKDGLHYTIRDDGVFVLVGRMLCSEVRSRAQGQRSR